jgi:acyl carrier protein
MQTKNSLEKKVLLSLKRILGNKSARLAMDSKLKEDLELDSFAIMELIFELEDTLGIRIPEDQLNNVKSVKDTLSLVHRLHSGTKKTRRKS